jgi:hypothetical protein
MGPHDRKILNNLVLGRFVTVRGEYIGQIRAGIYNVGHGRVADSEVLWHIESLRGSLNFLRLFDIKKADKFLAQLSAVIEGLATVGN